MAYDYLVSNVQEIDQGTSILELLQRDFKDTTVSQRIIYEFEKGKKVTVKVQTSYYGETKASIAVAKDSIGLAKGEDKFNIIEGKAVCSSSTMIARATGLSFEENQDLFEFIAKFNKVNNLMKAALNPPQKAEILNLVVIKDKILQPSRVSNLI